MTFLYTTTREVGDDRDVTFGDMTKEQGTLTSTSTTTQRRRRSSTTSSSSAAGTTNSKTAAIMLDTMNRSAADCRRLKEEVELFEGVLWAHTPYGKSRISDVSIQIGVNLY